MRLATAKGELVEALTGIANLDRRQRARRFLEGLSTDELEYIAAYLGAQLIDSVQGLSETSRAQLAARIERYECTRGGSEAGCWPACRKPVGKELRAGDVRHKMILLLEYLSLSCIKARPTSWSVRAGSA